MELTYPTSWIERHVCSHLRSISSKASSFSLITTCCAILLCIILWAYLGEGLRDITSCGRRRHHNVESRTNFIKDVSNTGNERCIIRLMNNENKDLVVFFGSQTGNSQDLAERLGKEGHSRFGLQTMVADLEKYDWENLVNIPPEKVVIFMLSSYGEGEPTDNAVQFFEFITAKSEVSSLRNMQFAIFGLGNSTYEHYNLVARKVDASLRERGAKRIGPLGEGDDATGSTEEDFLSWKDTMWEALGNIMDFQEQESTFVPSFIVAETESLSQSENLFLGQVGSSQSGAQTASIVPVKKCYELFKSKDRNCIHLELDIQMSGLTYQTGDHVAIWPMNSNEAVDRFLRAFGLLDKRYRTICVSSADGASQLPLPSPTTYDTAVRYYMEIGGPVSRQFLQTISGFVDDAVQRVAFVKLGQDKDHFSKVVSSQFLDLARLVETINPNNPVCTIPFAILLEGVRSLQPRYYSISSSSLIQKDEVAITAVVESARFSERWFKGVATNYLLGLKRRKHGEKSLSGEFSYTFSGRGCNQDGLSVAAYIRRSDFRLPTDITRPVIMVGAGTGIAPFRAFIHERAALVSSGLSPAKMILFYGCRKRTEDFIYEEEWKVGIRQPVLRKPCLFWRIFAYLVCARFARKNLVINSRCIQPSLAKPRTRFMSRTKSRTFQPTYGLSCLIVEDISTYVAMLGWLVKYRQCYVIFSARHQTSPTQGRQSSTS